MTSGLLFFYKPILRVLTGLGGDGDVALGQLGDSHAVLRPPVLDDRAFKVHQIFGVTRIKIKAQFHEDALDVFGQGVKDLFVHHAVVGCQHRPAVGEGYKFGYLVMLERIAELKDKVGSENGASVQGFIAISLAHENRVDSHELHPLDPGAAVSPKGLALELGIGFKLLPGRQLELAAAVTAQRHMLGHIQFFFEIWLIFHGV